MTVRAALLATIACIAGLAGCPRSGQSECTQDSECDGDVCARDGECLPASSVMSLRVRWTVRGEPASTVNCQGHEDLFVYFEGPNPGETIGFAPVPCITGQFSIDKLPRTYETVEVGVEGGASDVAQITGPEVTVDLPF